MKTLRELLAVAGKKAVLNRLNDKKGTSLTKTLLELLEDPDLTEDQAAKALYGPTANRKLAAFKTLKSRLKEIMLVAIQKGKVVELDYSTYNAAFESGFRQLYTIQVLLVSRAYSAAREIAKQTFYNVRDYEILLLNHGLTNQLANLHLGVGYNEKLVKKYNDINLHYSEALFMLSKLENRYRKVRDMIYSNKAPLAEIGRLSLQYLEEFSESRITYAKVSQVQGMIYSLEITGFMYIGDYLDAIESSKRGELVLANCKGVSSSVMNFLLLAKLESILKAEDFELGRSEIMLAQEKLPENSMNGIKVIEYAIRLGLWMQKFDYAYLCLANFNRRLVKRLLTTEHQEYWMIWEAYINFLVVAGRIKPQDDWPKLPRFKFAKFFNNVPAFSRNKTGMNIPILILQTIYFIIIGKYGTVVDRTEALERYCSRYLKDDENLRHNCFFKLILITVQANFHKGATERKAATVYSRMVNARERSIDIEIIPYEALWEIVLENLSLDRRARAVSKGVS